jgi:streptogramin lyase
MAAAQPSNVVHQTERDWQMKTIGATSVLLAAAVMAGAGGAPRSGHEYSFRVVASGLNAPTGIAAQGSGRLFFTEVPTPGIPGSMGGTNAVKRLQLASGNLDTLSMGEPEPVNIAVRGMTAYWTCKSAGVILSQGPNGQTIVVLSGLDDPSGIAIGDGVLYFTQVPTPGVMGGANTVNSYEGTTISTISMGEPEPVDIAVGPDGTAYWTCKSAGVILHLPPGGMVAPLLTGLNDPNGIAVDHRGEYLYFTEVPTPGVPGSMGGTNTVNRVHLGSLDRIVINMGDQEPTDVTVAPNGTVYWTCTVAGVIVEAKPRRGRQ